MDDRARSRSPERRTDSDRERPKKSSGGFRWKDKRRDSDSRYGRDERRLERGYKDRPRSRSPRRERDADRDQDRHRDSDRDRKRPDDEARREKKKKKEKKPAPATTSEPMITVIVNDRLGTKASIPCLASDPISWFTPSTGGYRANTF